MMLKFHKRVENPGEAHLLADGQDKKMADLDEMILTGLSESIIFVTQKNSLIHPNTVIARNELLLMRN